MTDQELDEIYMSEGTHEQILRQRDALIKEVASSRAELAEVRAKLEQLVVQLAGCGVAALGYSRGANKAKPGDYGWSASYQDVVRLRDRAEALFDVEAMLILCPENECRGIKPLALKLRALIDGLIHQRRRAEVAEKRLEDAAARIKIIDDTWLPAHDEVCAELEAAQEQIERLAATREQQPGSVDLAQVDVNAGSIPAGSAFINERNAFVQRRYDELMSKGQHGHYETLFRVVREAIEREVPPSKPTEEMLRAGRGWREWDTNDEALSRAYQAMVALGRSR